jgi:prevent-host-death family protein
MICVSDAKARLSGLLRDAQLGHEWTITERGKPIARLVPIAASQASLEERLVRLVKSGVIERAPTTESRLPEPLRVPAGLARRMLDEDREA